jgi:hypothetical protein
MVSAERDYERLWETIRPRLHVAQVAAIHMLSAPLTVSDFDRIRNKGWRGYLEHGGGIVRMTSDDLLVEARAECDDLLFYTAKRLG